MKFDVIAKKLGEGITKHFTYDNMSNQLRDENNTLIGYPNVGDTEERVEVDDLFPEDRWSKSKHIRTLKIQLGLSCNYACIYCSQRFVNRPPETTKKHIDKFMSRLKVLHFSEKLGLGIQIWGGEPLVYYKTIEPLVEALDEKFKDWTNKPHYSIITNGSLLTKEINDWLVDHKFNVAVSHDGPGQNLRGPDPFDDPEKKEAILDLYHRLKPLGKFSFNAMLNKHNISRKEIHQWFINMTQDEGVILGEGGMIDPYDEGGYSTTLGTYGEHFEFRKKSFNDIYSNNGNIGFTGILDKINQFMDKVLNHRSIQDMGQKCGMDDPHTLTVDLNGNVLTCQNVSQIEKAPNGKSHKAGTLDDYDNVKVESSTHWSDRPDCARCPILAICQGSCMFLQDKNWDRACKNAYTESIVMFSLAFEKLTGMIPIYIDAPHLPEYRKDIWGTLKQYNMEEEIV